jgi:hypothetical protein
MYLRQKINIFCKFAGNAILSAKFRREMPNQRRYFVRYFAAKLFGVTVNLYFIIRGGLNMATIQKRNNSYRIKVSCGYDVNGKQVIQSKTYKPETGMTEKQIEKEVNRQAVLFEQECQKGQITAAVKFETFAGQYLEEYAKANLRHTTYIRYWQFTRKVFPAIGHLSLDRVTARNIQLFINGLSQDGVNEVSGKPLAPKTVRLYQGFISSVFTYAIKMGMLTDNPCGRVTLPKLDILKVSNDSYKFIRGAADDGRKGRDYVYLVEAVMVIGGV